MGAGSTTGIDLYFVSAVFKNGSGTVIPGGGFFGYDALDPTNGAPDYDLPQTLAPGAVSSPRLVDLILPAGATTATVTVIVRTNTYLGYPPNLTDWFLTTLAGHRRGAGFC